MAPTSSLVLEHGHGGNRPRTTQFGEVPQWSITFSVSQLCRNIGNVCDLPRPRDAAHGASGVGKENRLLRSLFGKRAGDIVRGNRTKAVTLGQVQHSEFGTAEF